VAEVRIDLDGIRGNTAAVARLLSSSGLDLVGVTKGVAGEPRVARAMVEGGAAALADTHDAHLRGLRAALPEVELHRILLPPAHALFAPGDISHVTSIASAGRIATLGTPTAPQAVMVQIETGDLREGVPVEEVVELAVYVEGEPRLRLEGLSTNYACFAGDPTGIEASLDVLVRVVADVRAAGLPVPRVSGGNSSLLGLLSDGWSLPAEITEVRCGEALLLGREALHYRPLPGCRQDAVLLRAEVVERYTKGVAGSRSERLVLAIGHQDLGAGTVVFREPGLVELGRSSDYVVVGVEAGSVAPEVGDMVQMLPDYVAMTAACTSPFVEVLVD